MDLKEKQIKVLKRLSSYTRWLANTAKEEDSSYRMKYFLRMTEGMLEVYEIIFGVEEFNKITSETGFGGNRGINEERLNKYLEKLEGE